MNQRQQTITLVIVAALAALIAWGTRPASIVDARFADVGAPLAPLLTDPGQVRQIEVIAYDQDLARHTALLLRFRDGRWTVPSAYDYPADAAGRIAEAAAMLVGLTREAVVTERRIDHAALGLVDPTDESGDPAGRGVKVTITGDEGQVLADVIIGGAFEGVAAERFVRSAGADRAYRTSFHAPPASTLSTRLVDWINPDLLRLGAGDIASIELDASSVDESSGTRVEGERYTIRRDPETGDWAGEGIETSSADALAEAIAGLRLVGVEPMPSKLTALLTGVSADAALDSDDLVNLSRAGYFLSPTGQLVPNAGNLIIGTTDGLTLTLWFGEVAQTAAGAASLFEDGPAGDAADPAPTRYVFVTVRATDPGDAAAAEAAADRLRRLSSWWYRIEEPDFESIRPALEELRAATEEPEQPAP